MSLTTHESDSKDDTKDAAVKLAKAAKDKKCADYLSRLEVRGGKAGKGGK